MYVETIKTDSLGNRGYLIHDGTVGVVIDVQRDYQRWLDAAQHAGVKITHVIETHMHNDYVTGGYQLAQSIDAEYIVPTNSHVHFPVREVHDEEEIAVGDLTVTALHTPGHTEHHMSYRVTDGSQDAVFTGGGILYGTVGRTDLVAKDKTAALTAAQYDSAQRLGHQLTDATAVFPTHGFGSFCSSSTGTGATSSTIASEKKYNIAFTAKDRESFIETIIAGLGPYPRYYAHMGPMNQEGPSAVRQLHLHDYASTEIANFLREENSWVIDTRQRKAFASSHPQGALGIELGNSFSTYTGWLIPWGDTMTLVGDNEAELRQAYLELSRIGMEQFVQGASAAIATYQTAAPTSQYRVADFSDLQKERTSSASPYVLDVRLATGWETLHIKNTVNIPLHELPERVNELPDNQPIWVHCASGYRASIAASLIDRSGRQPILISDQFDRADSYGLLAEE